MCVPRTSGATAGRLALERRRHVAVGVERHRDLRVPEPLLDDLGLDAGCEGEVALEERPAPVGHQASPASANPLSAHGHFA